MKKTIAVIATLISMAGLAAGTKRAAVTFTQEEVKWAQPFGPQGPSLGFVAGKLGDKKPASFFARFPGGADTGWHEHSADYEGIVLKGTFTEQQQGEEERALPAGTYFTQPRKQNHRNGCQKSEDCVVYVHFEHGADTTPLTADGRPVPPPPKTSN